MPAFYADRLIQSLRDRARPEKVHTVVLWTKDPLRMLRNRELIDCLREYEQLFFLISITGMGGTVLEPGIPPAEHTVEALPEIVELAGIPGRVRVRFDPIVHLVMQSGRHFSNIDRFAYVADHCRKNSIGHMILSWLQVYPKVRNRLENRGIEPLSVSQGQIVEQAAALEGLAAGMNIQLQFCATEPLHRSRCIDGGLLSELHPRGEPADSTRAGGQRDLCGCTRSWDIGWYFRCPGGCLYCYANPAAGNR